MKLTLNQAAKECGRAKSTLSKAVKSGKLSAEEQEDGSFRIDPSELFRVFPKQDETKQKLLTSNTSKNSENSLLPVSLQLELIEAKAKLESEAGMRARLETEISDLREQRDKWQKQAETLLLSHQAAPPVPASERRGLLARLFG